MPKFNGDNLYSHLVRITLLHGNVVAGGSGVTLHITPHERLWSFGPPNFSDFYPLCEPRGDTALSSMASIPCTGFRPNAGVTSSLCLNRRSRKYLGASVSAQGARWICMGLGLELLVRGMSSY